MTFITINPAASLNAVIIVNKRDLGNLAEYARVISSNINASISARVVDLGSLGLCNQLEIFGNTDIYISGVGTALTSSFLLPDGAVVVNLGDVDNSNVVGFWDEYIVGSAEWLGAIYAPVLKRRSGLNGNLVSNLAIQAAQLLRSNFSLTQNRIMFPKLDNLSPAGKAIAGYFDIDNKPWLLMTGALATSANPTDCIMKAWAEKLVCTKSQDSIYFSEHCSPLNVTLLNEIASQTADFVGLCP